MPYLGPNTGCLNPIQDSEMVSKHKNLARIISAAAVAAAPLAIATFPGNTRLSYRFFTATASTPTPTAATATALNKVQQIVAHPRQLGFARGLRKKVESEEERQQVIFIFCQKPP